MGFCNNIYVLILLWLFSLLINHTCICKVSDQVLCISSERQALLKFKQHLQDPSGRLTSWSEETDCCNWTSIVCDDVTGHILQLRLSYSHLNYHSCADETFGGEIHSSILDLKHLSYFDLSGNDFNHMQIPSFLGSLKSLRYLNLSSGGFSGSIPHQITNLSSLIYLDLGGNDFIGKIPHQIGNLSSLHYLNLHGGYYGDTDRSSCFPENLQWLPSLSSLKFLQLSFVKLSNAFDWLHVLQSLPALRELHLTSCSLHNHFDPAIVTNFTSLAILDLSDAYAFGASSIPRWIFQLKNLASLQLRGNDLQGFIPNGIQNLTFIEDLDLSYNAFNNSIPKWLYSLNRLKSLSLSSNKLNGLISNEIGNLNSIVTLDLSYNQLEGQIPRTFGNLYTLRSVSFSNNKFNQQFSEILKILARCASHTLESLSISNSKLHGQLTSQIGIFKNLLYLDLYGNSFIGEIPKSLRNLTSLNQLDLSSNRFNGNPFDVIGSLSALQSLFLGDNLFQGEVTEDHFANFTRLYEFYAGRNKLILKVGPHWKPSFQKLKALHMGSWNLGPHFPSWMKSLKCLDMLSIPNNNISDSILTWVWDAFPHVDLFDFSNNNIHGDLSHTLKNPINVLFISLASNHLSGHLPYISPNMITLDLSNNLFSGSLDSFLCQGKVKQMSLTNLNLQSNNLFGEIPDCWMMWPNLVSVKFDSNNISGNMPHSLGSLPSLNLLGLRNNTLSGNFPTCLKKNTRLVYLDLSENQLTGLIPLWLGHDLLNLKIFLLRSNKFSGHIPNQICHLNSLQALDLADNNLTGEIPKCINNLTAMLIMNNSLESYISTQGNHITYPIFITDVNLTLKGRNYDYPCPGLIMSIDLSENKLDGEIPYQVTSLMGMMSLNMSNNLLHGEIPQNIGNMRSLQSMDFSNNKLSGEIPPTISNLNFLSMLNLSYNNLHGKIPKGTQVQTFEANSFTGNDLCGPPLPKKCIEQDDARNHGDDEKEARNGNGVKWFYVSMSLGFVSGFWIVVAPLLYSESWRYTYFCFLDRMWYRLQSFCW